MGMDALGNMLNSAGHGIGDFFKGHMSEGGQKVMDTPLYQDGYFTDTAKNPLNWPIVAADAVGQTAPVIAASAAGGVPLATAAGFAQNAGGTSEAVHSAIMNADDNQLMQSSTFVNLFKISTRIRSIQATATCKRLISLKATGRYGCYGRYQRP